MSIEELILMLENRVRYNASLRNAAVARGDVAAITALDADDASTNQALDVLRAALV